MASVGQKAEQIPQPLHQRPKIVILVLHLGLAAALLAVSSSTTTNSLVMNMPPLAGKVDVPAGFRQSKGIMSLSNLAVNCLPVILTCKQFGHPKGFVSDIASLILEIRWKELC